jgi:NTP pyrophosphatase (non-canonical NTP hydrolase)
MNENTITFADMRAANLARQAEWDADTQFSAMFFSNALAGEAGELAEATQTLLLASSVVVKSGNIANMMKKLERKSLGLRGSEATLEDIAREMADCLTYIDLLAARLGVDLAMAYTGKFNQISENYGMQARLQLQNYMVDNHRPRLGMATNDELAKEIAARHAIGADEDPNYRPWNPNGQVEQGSKNHTPRGDDE